MGLFSKIKEATSLVTGNDHIAGALLGRGIITAIELTGSSITIGAIEQYVCHITVEVALDDTQRYVTVCKQKMPAWTIAQVQPGNTTVAVRVDPTDRTRVALDWDTPAPTVRAPQSTQGSSAADVLERGLSCRVAILQFQDMGMVSQTGLPIYAFALSVLPEAGKPYQVQIGNPVLPDAIPLLYPGAQLPAKVLADDPNSIVIDFAAALTAV
ncbi:MAG: hypothetical protein Q8M22_17365 [Actinomycetota bacterium]|nr:hypothetical protein [Actinomycetota bacterium]